jgi:MFS family permease
VKPIALLFVALFNSILGLSVLFPIVGPLGRELGFNEVQVGSFSAAYALMQFAMSTYWGRQSERIGRKPVLLRGVIGFGVGFLGFAICAQLALAHVVPPQVAFVLMLVARVVGGAFSSATIPTAQAYVADVTPRGERTSGMALIGAAFGLGVVFGPGIGALLANISLLTPVYFSATFAFINAIFVYYKLPEPTERRITTPAEPLRVSDRRISPLLLIGFALSLASVAMEQTVAFYFQDRLELSAVSTTHYVGGALFVYGLVAVFVQGFLIRRYKLTPKTLLLLGLPIALLGFVTFVLALHFPALLLALTLQGFGSGLAAPGVTAALSLAVTEQEQGAVAGLNGSAQGLGRMLGPLVGTGLYGFNPTFPYVFSAILLTLVFGYLLLHRQAVEQRTSQSPST